MVQAVSDLLGLDSGFQLALVLSTVFVAGFLRGFIGFGAALITVPVLALVLGPLVAVPLASLISMPSVVQLLPTVVRSAERPIVVPISLAVFAATPLGAWLLVSTDPRLMKIVISVLVIVLVAMLAKGWRLQGQVRTGVLVCAGMAGGLIQGTAGIGGPPVVAVAMSRPGSSQQQRANVLGVMTAIALSSLAPLWYHGLYTQQVILIAVLLWPVNALATWAGAHYFSTDGHRHFRGAALIMLAVIGSVTLIAAVRDYVAG